MLRRTCWFVVLVVISTSLSAQQTIYWKKDHIYNGPGGKEIAVAVPAPSDSTVPSTPTGVGYSSVTANSVQISWSASTDSGGSGLAGYKVYRQLGSGASLPVGTVGTGTLSFTDQPLVPSTSYTYKVVAFDNAQNHSTASSSVSVTTSSGAGDSTVPTAPPNLRARGTGNYSIRLDWYGSTDKGGSGLAGYRVYRDGTLVSGASPITTPYFDDTGLNIATTYPYTVKAVDGAGNLSSASAVNGTTTGTLVFQDNFNRSDSSNLASSNWSGNGAPFHIASNQAAASVYSADYWANAFSSTGVSDFSAQVTFVNNPRSTGILFWAGTSGGAMPGYRVTIQDFTSMTLAYYYDMPGTGGQALSSVTLSGVPGTLRVEGNSATRAVKVYWNNVLVISYTVSTIYGSNIGLTSYVGNQEGDRILDDFVLGRP